MVFVGVFWCFGIGAGKTTPGRPVDGDTLAQRCGGKFGGGERKVKRRKGEKEEKEEKMKNGERLDFEYRERQREGR